MIRITALLLGLMINCQSYFNLQEDFGNAGVNQGYSVIMLNDHIIVYDATNCGNDCSCIRLLKFTMVGELIDQKEYAFCDPDYDISVKGTMIATSDGGFALAGEIDSSTEGLNKAFIRFDECMDTLFTAYYPLPLRQFGRSLIETSDGHFIICGSTDTLQNWGDLRGHLTKVNALGELIWHKEYNHQSSISNSMRYIDLDNDGGFTIGGNSYYGETDSTDSYYRGLIYKVDSDGNLLWIFEDPGIYGPQEFMPSTDSWIQVRSFPEEFGGGYVYRILYGYYDPPQVKSHKSMVIRLDESLNELWRYYDGEIYDVRVDQLYVDDYGNTAFCGENLVFQTEEGEYDTQRSGWLVKLDQYGNETWEHQYHAEIPDDEQPYYTFYDMQILEDGSIVATGPVRQGIETQTDVWLVKVDSLGCPYPNCEPTDTVFFLNRDSMMEELQECTIESLNPEILDINQRRVFYPNPVTNILFAREYVRDVSIYDINGQVVKHNIQGVSQYDMTFLNNGVYIINYKNNQGDVRSEVMLKM